jgi:hypothetical protein
MMGQRHAWYAPAREREQRVLISNRHHRRSSFTAWPDTVMSQAYLHDPVQWTVRHLHNPKATIALPIGLVNVGEVAQVLRALNRARTTEEQQT